MTATAFTPAQTASVASAVLIAGVAAFQIALAIGLPLGEAVLGGTASTQDGVLSGPMRALATVQAALLLMMAWVVLARTEILPIPIIGSGVLVPLVWVVALLLALNTAANLASPHPVERWVMGSVTLVLTMLTVFIALRAPTPTLS